MSKPHVARAAHLSVPTVDLAIEYLIERGLVEPVGQRRGGRGRSAALFRLRGDAAQIIAIDIGVRRWRLSVSDLAGIETRHEMIPSPASGGVLPRLTQLIDDLIGSLTPQTADLVLAVATPGVPHPTSGRLQFVENIPDLVDVPLGNLLEARYAATVVVENDVNLAALAEQREGRAVGCENFAFISIGNGVGMGAVVDGHPLRGSRGAAGELGLLPFPVQPASLKVRRHGALESAIGADAIRRRTRELIKAGKPTVLSPRASVEDVLAAATDGDQLAVSVLQEVAAALATAIAAAVVVLDSELIVLGGGIGSQPVLVESSVAALRSILDQPVQLVSSALRAEATLVGARAMGRDVLLAQLMESVT
jgi:predicted NBD/HSP70 family sugar kinase